MAETLVYAPDAQGLKFIKRLEKETMVRPLVRNEQQAQRLSRLGYTNSLNLNQGSHSGANPERVFLFEDEMINIISIIDTIRQWSKAKIYVITSNQNVIRHRLYKDAGANFVVYTKSNCANFLGF